MSVYYLIDAHTNPLLSSEINDVIDSRTDLLSSGNPAAVVNGNFVVRIGDDQRLAADPTSLSDLLTQKYNGLKERYGFANILYDSLLDPLGVTPSNQLKLGERGAIGTLGTTLSTAMQVASTTVSNAVVVFEFFRWRYINPKDGRLLRIYEELPQTTAVALSTNGVGFTNVSASGAPVSIPLGSEGTQVILEFSPPPSSNNPILIGSWAVLY